MTETRMKALWLALITVIFLTSNGSAYAKEITLNEQLSTLVGPPGVTSAPTGFIKTGKEWGIGSHIVPAFASSGFSVGLKKKTKSLPLSTITPSVKLPEPTVPVSVPEPTTLVLLSTGLAFVALGKKVLTRSRD